MGRRWGTRRVKQTSALCRLDFDRRPRHEGLVRVNASRDERRGMPRCGQSVAVQRPGAANRPLRPLLPAPGAICGCPCRSKGAIMGLRLAEIWRKSDKIR
jgi:hypothetical protein